MQLRVMLLQLLESLVQIHEDGFVLKDIKPQNIVVMGVDAELDGDSGTDRDRDRGGGFAYVGEEAAVGDEDQKETLRLPEAGSGNPKAKGEGSRGVGVVGMPH